MTSVKFLQDYSDDGKTWFKDGWADLQDLLDRLGAQSVAYLLKSSIIMEMPSEDGGGFDLEKWKKNPGELTPGQRTTITDIEEIKSNAEYIEGLDGIADTPKPQEQAVQRRDILDEVESQSFENRLKYSLKRGCALLRMERLYIPEGDELEEAHNVIYRNFPARAYVWESVSLGELEPVFLTCQISTRANLPVLAAAVRDYLTKHPELSREDVVRSPPWLFSYARIPRYFFHEFIDDNKLQACLETFKVKGEKGLINLFPRLRLDLCVLDKKK